MATDTISNVSEYLSFQLAEELFALDIGRVREVIEFTSVTKVPRMPVYMRGIINLRGGVVPVIDMRQKFGMGETQKDINTCVIILEVRVGENLVVLGAMADAVDEVFDLTPEQIEPAPRIGTHLNTRFLKGMGKKGEEFILLLDIDNVFSDHELQQAAERSEASADTDNETVSHN